MWETSEWQFSFYIFVLLCIFWSSVLIFFLGICDSRLRAVTCLCVMTMWKEYGYCPCFPVAVSFPDPTMSATTDALHRSKVGGNRITLAGFGLSLVASSHLSLVPGCAASHGVAPSVSLTLDGTANFETELFLLVPQSGLFVPLRRSHLNTSPPIFHGHAVRCVSAYLCWMFSPVSLLNLL